MATQQVEDALAEGAELPKDVRSVSAGTYVCRVLQVLQRRDEAGFLVWRLRWQVDSGEEARREVAWQDLSVAPRHHEETSASLRAMGLDPASALEGDPPSLRASALHMCRAELKLVDAVVDDPRTGEKLLVHQVVPGSMRMAPPKVAGGTGDD
jgi:hypothetical protein